MALTWETDILSKLLSTARLSEKEFWLFTWPILLRCCFLFSKSTWPIGASASNLEAVISSKLPLPGLVSYWWDANLFVATLLPWMTDYTCLLMGESGRFRSGVLCPLTFTGLRCSMTFVKKFGCCLVFVTTMARCCWGLTSTVAEGPCRSSLGVSPFLQLLVPDDEWFWSEMSYLLLEEAMRSWVFWSLRFVRGGMITCELELRRDLILSSPFCCVLTVSSCCCAPPSLLKSLLNLFSLPDIRPVKLNFCFKLAVKMSMPVAADLADVSDAVGPAWPSLTTLLLTAWWLLVHLLSLLLA